MDVLTDVLKTAGITLRVNDVSVREIPWRLEAKSAESVAFYAIAEGRCQLSVMRKTTLLVGGDVVFVNHAAPHFLEGSGPDRATIISGTLTFSAGFQGVSFLGIPPVLVLPAAEGTSTAMVFGRFVSEATSSQPGWQAASEGMALALFVDALRAHGASHDGGAHGWLRGLADNEIGQALRMMHERPAHRWTVAELAQALSVSRSTFAARFKTVTGRPPLDYLTWWRLHRAAARLRRLDGATIAMVAREAGYDSDASFGKAFRREFGKSPGAVRREVSAGVASPLQFELKKQTPFEIPEQEAGLNLTKTAWQFQTEGEALFARHGLIPSEYNVLRILRGVGSPIPKTEILARLVVPNSDPQRLFAKLVKARHVQWVRKSDVYSITDQGREILQEIDEPLVDMHRRQLAHFSSGEMAELNRLLVKARRPEN